MNAITDTLTKRTYESEIIPLREKIDAIDRDHHSNISKFTKVCLQ